MDISARRLAQRVVLDQAKMECRHVDALPILNTARCDAINRFAWFQYTSGAVDCEKVKRSGVAHGLGGDGPG